MSQSDIYTIICIVAGEDVPFCVEIEKSKTVGWLKALIKEKRTNVFADIDVNFLDLYHVDIPNDEELVVRLKAHPLDDSKLRATKPLTDVFPATPKADTVHFIVNPSKLHGWPLGTCVILTFDISVPICAVSSQMSQKASYSNRQAPPLSPM